MNRIHVLIFLLIMAMGACSKNSSDATGNLTLENVSIEGQHFVNPPHDAITVHTVVKSSYTVELKNVIVGVVVANNAGRVVGTKTSTPITLPPGGSNTVIVYVSPLTSGALHTDITDVRITPYCEHGASAEVSVNPQEQ
ncbi:hypothetical protein ACFL5H_02985 [Candidatus Latescibacterota bacterium]